MNLKECIIGAARPGILENGGGRLGRL